MVSFEFLLKTCLIYDHEEYCVKTVEREDLQVVRGPHLSQGEILVNYRPDNELVDIYGSDDDDPASGSKRGPSDGGAAAKRQATGFGFIDFCVAMGNLNTGRL